MKKHWLVVGLVVMLAGCATVSKEAILQASNSVNLEDGVTKKEALLVAQKCLVESEYQDQYSPGKYDINYDKGEFPFTNLWKYGRAAWLIQFISKQENDECMYGAVVFQDGKESHCGCMYGM